MFVRSIRGVAARNAIEYVTWLSPSHSESAAPFHATSPPPIFPSFFFTDPSYFSSSFPLPFAGYFSQPDSLLSWPRNPPRNFLHRLSPFAQIRARGPQQARASCLSSQFYRLNAYLSDGDIYRVSPRLAVLFVLRIGPRSLWHSDELALRRTNERDTALTLINKARVRTHSLGNLKKRTGDWHKTRRFA